MHLRFHILSLCFALLVTLGGCHKSEPQKQSIQTTPVELSGVPLGRSQLEKKQFEEAAVTLRATLDHLESKGATDAELSQAKELCTKALVQAGGFVESHALWKDLAQKNPDSKKEATRMIEHAERKMAQQAEELMEVAKEDHKAKHTQKALATAQAAIELYDLISDGEERAKAAQTWKDSLLEKKR